jgi:hypothetical protein
MTGLRMAVGTASCIAALFFGGVARAGDAQCWQPYEIEAARVRDLQIMLMLGSLKCRMTNSEIRAKYDHFYEKTGNVANYNNALKLRFMRQSGIADGGHAYDEFITRLANSHAGNAQSAGFCQMVDTLLTLASNAGEGDIPVLARNFSENPAGVGEVCEAAIVAAAPPVAAEVAAPAPASAPRVAEVTPQSAAAALEAAAAALQTAAASLKTPPVAAPAPEVGSELKPTQVAESKPIG